MTTYVTTFNDFPGPWVAAWCIECRRYIHVDPDVDLVRQKGFDHDHETHTPADPFDGPEFQDFPDSLD
ncbi:hypothetical protein [Curtobacterium sp. MCPF17_052]|uniref:hypothetical protein n=1 Tax=Curtobacterium sp. MCPF17_052 TaxID=2175655 RepID=UPI000DAA633D|nr:hypothetical protein [Curtobacterium sp. MCPF17_052]WIB12904.1 hypothetical protein DEJ36_02445 [Curtobacterium sp. MCPF17_052]